MSENIPENTPEESLDEDFEAEVDTSESSNRNLIILIVVLLAVIFCGVLAIVFLLLRSAGTEEVPTVAATAEPIEPPAIGATEAPGATDEPESAVDEAWTRIQESGRINVGTSADYPPFEYYTEEFELDGFDIALIREIGQLMGLEIELQDMAFDGLGNALQVGQIDVAIAAISVTPEREAVVDFSTTYFLGLDALLAAEGQSATISTVDDLALYRLGVQRGSVYESFAEDELIEPGIMPRRNLHIYQDVDQAVDDLGEGRIDFVAMDRLPAEVAASQDDYVIAATGLNRQELAIAMPQDSFILQAEINNTLAELQSTGRIAELVKQYLDLDDGEIEPVPTPEPGLPTATPAPPLECIDSMRYVSDLNMDDANMTSPPQLSPGQTFQKGWRLRNTGTCAWDNSYALIPVGGNSPAARMGGIPIVVDGLIQPGQTYDFWADLVAPLNPGVYQEFWTMRNVNNGLLFGDRVWVGVEVVAWPTATPLPTQTPSPFITFSADPTNIQAGECSVLSWSTQNVREVYLYPQGQSWQGNGVPGIGQRTVCPPQTTTYELRVVKLDNTVEIRQVTVFVTANPGAPVINSFSVDPPSVIEVGECVAISWSVSGQVQTVNISRNNSPIWAGAPVAGTMEDCPPGSGEQVYAIEAIGPGGTSRQQQYINAVPGATATPIPTSTPIPTAPPASTATEVPPTPLPTATNTPPPPDPPVIYSFSAKPGQVVAGAIVNVTWSAGGGTEKVNILKNGAVVLEGAEFNGSGQDQLNDVGTVVYSIEAIGSQGEQVTKQATVTVVEAPPENPLAGTSWTLVSYLSGDTLQPVLAGSSVTASFNDKDDLSGSSGCNTYSAPYTVNGSNITIGELTGTQKTCPDPAGLMDQETAYLALLPMAATYQTQNGQMFILDDTGQTILSFAMLVATPF